MNERCGSPFTTKTNFQYSSHRLCWGSQEYIIININMFSLNQIIMNEYFLCLVIIANFILKLKLQDLFDYSWVYLTLLKMFPLAYLTNFLKKLDYPGCARCLPKIIFPIRKRFPLIFLLMSLQELTCLVL